MIKKLFQIMTRSFFIFLIGIILWSFFPSAAASAAGCNCIPPPPGMVGWWPLDETSGSTVNDISLSVIQLSNGNDGTTFGGSIGGGIVPVQGEVKGALMFSSPGYAQVPNSTTLNFSGDFSIDAWIKPNLSVGCSSDPGLHVSSIVDKWAGSQIGPGYRLFVVQSLGLLELNFRVGDGTFFVPNTAPIPMDGMWHHVTAVYRAGISLELFIDGVPASTAAANILTNPISNSDPLLIGQMSPLAPPFVDQGFCEMPVDEVEIFDRALDLVGDIGPLVDAGTSGKCKCVTPPPGLVAWWPLEDVSTVAPSLVGDHTGLFAGAPLPSAVAGKVGNALDLSGSNWVLVPNHPALDFGTSDFSADAWVNPGSSGLRPIIDKRSWPNGTSNPSIGYYIYLSAGYVAGQLSDGTNTFSFNTFLNSLCPTIVSNTGWHFVGVSVDRGSGIVKVSVDKHIDCESFSIPASLGSLANPADLYIGAGNPPLTLHFQGGLDEVELFNRALTGPELLPIYNAGAGGKCKLRTAVPQTGQSECYNAVTGTLAPCPSISPLTEDGRIQAGVLWPSMRFTTAGSGIVLDNLNGLEWTQDAGTPSIPPCGGGAPMNWTQALAYVACLNTISHLGHNDWRLPNINELFFVNAGLQPGSYLTYLPGWLTAEGFTGFPGYALQHDYYWSSTTGDGSTSQAWSMDFDSGIADYDPKTNLYYVWPVRGGQSCDVYDYFPATNWQTRQVTSYQPPEDDGALQWGVPWPSPRFTDNLDTCSFTDDLTGLIWMRDAGTPTVQPSMAGNPTCNAAAGPISTWFDALDYVQCLNTNFYCNHNDWRLPNVNELHSLVDYEENAPALPLDLANLFFAPGSVQMHHYWSSTANAGGGGNMGVNDAWTVDFVSGGVYHNIPSSGLPYVLPVRGGSLLCYPISAGNTLQSVTIYGLTITFPAGSVSVSGNVCVQATSINPNLPNFSVVGGGYSITFSGQLSPNTNPTVAIVVPGGCINGAVISHYTGVTSTSLTTTASVTGTNCTYTAPTPSFSVFTVMEPTDTTPDPFAFTEQTGVALSTVATSNTITVTGIDAAAPVSITDGTYSINSGAYTSTAATVNNGDTVTVRQTSSGSYSTTTSATLTIGTVSDTFSVTTLAAPPASAGGNMYVTTSGQADAACVNDVCNGSVNNGYKLIDASTPLAADGGDLYIYWGDGTPIERHDPGGSFMHTYNHIGKYRVTQTVTDENGNKSQQHWTVNVSGGSTGKGTLTVSASGSAYFNIGYKVMDGNTTVTTGAIAVGGSKSIMLDAKTYSVKFTYQSKTPLTDPLTYHSCSTLPPGAATSSNGSTVTVSNVTVPTGGTISVSLNDCNN